MRVLEEADKVLQSQAFNSLENGSQTGIWPLVAAGQTERRMGTCMHSGTRIFIYTEICFHYTDTHINMHTAHTQRNTHTNTHLKMLSQEKTGRFAPQQTHRTYTLIHISS